MAFGLAGWESVDCESAGIRMDRLFLFCFPITQSSPTQQIRHRLGWHVDLDGSIVVAGYLVVVSTWKRRRRKTKLSIDSAFLFSMPICVTGVE
jgi:hypothetical protein